MQVEELIYRQEQRSLLREEQCEVRTLMRISHNGQTGLLRIDSDYYKRDCDSDYYCDCPGVDADVLAEDVLAEDGIDEQWDSEPQHTTETPEIKAMIIALANHRVSQN